MIVMMVMTDIPCIDYLNCWLLVEWMKRSVAVLYTVKRKYKNWLCINISIYSKDIKTRNHVIVVHW